MNIWDVIECVQGGAFLTHWEHTRSFNLMIFTQLFSKRNTSNEVVWYENIQAEYNSLFISTFQQQFEATMTID